MASKLVPLTKGAYAIVDQEDYEMVMAMGKWHINDSGYAVMRNRVSGTKKTIRMHRVINQTPDGLVTDHINRNRLDNRRNNLRSVTQWGNMQNVERGLGVWYQKQNRNWVVEVKKVHIGSFDSEELAMQIAHMVYEGELPLDRVVAYSPFCKRGHNKEVVGTYASGCRKCILENQYKYYRRKTCQIQKLAALNTARP